MQVSSPLLLQSDSTQCTTAADHLLDEAADEPRDIHSCLGWTNLRARCISELVIQRSCLPLFSNAISNRQK